MTETAAEYRDRIFHTLGSRPPLEVLPETPALLRDWMTAHDISKWNTPSGSDEWTPAQVLAHLSEGELVFAYRLRMIARSSGTNIQAFDQDVWMQDSNYLAGNPSLALQTFEAVRQANLAYIHSLNENVYNNYGIHSERGKETVADLLRMYAGHDLNHLRQIKERLAAPVR